MGLMTGSHYMSAIDTNILTCLVPLEQNVTLAPSPGKPVLSPIEKYWF